MTLRNRFLLVGFGIVVFLLVTPVLVLYARGFKIDWEARKLVKTGALVIKSEPAKAQIFLNDALQDTATPANLRFILPGDFNVRLEKDGYQPWTKRLTVKSQLVTWANHNRDFITLFLLNPKLEQSLEGTQISLSTEENKIIFTQSDRIKTIDVETAEIFEISDSPPNSIPTTTDDIKNAIAQFMYHPILPTFSQGQIIRTPTHIFLILDQTLYLINDELEKIYTPVKTAKHYTDSDQLIYGNDNEIYIYYPNDKNSDLILRNLTPITNPILNPETGYVFFQNENKIKAIEIDSRDHHNIFTIVDASDQFLVSSDGKKLFTVSQNEINYYTIR